MLAGRKPRRQRGRGLGSAASRAAGGEDRGAPPHDGAPAPKAQSRESLLRYQRSIQASSRSTFPRAARSTPPCRELAEKWNPLYAAAQKKNLVEDVNALVRDFLRPVRRSFLVRPPDLEADPCPCGAALREPEPGADQEARPPDALHRAVHGPLPAGEEHLGRPVEMCTKWPVSCRLSFACDFISA